MSSPLNIWWNLTLPNPVARELEKKVTPHRIRWSSSLAATNLSSGGSDTVLVEECEVAFGQPSVEDILAAKKLRLVCLSSAGYTRYDRDDLRDYCRSKGILVCNASSVFADPCAQHVLAMMMSLCRQLPTAHDAQRTDRSWAFPPIRAGSVLLNENSNIAIVGYGSIARRLVELLAPFRAKITAFRRTPTGDENCRTLPIAELDANLAETDHIVNILPAAKSTTNFFDAERFARAKAGAKFYNIGRGDTVDQSALMAALANGRLSAAYLDVTTPEPLPPKDPLWSLPNCYITPHVAGGSADEMERQVANFVENVRRFERGEAPRDVILKSEATTAS